MILVSANLGGVDKEITHVPQSVPFKQFTFTDSNFPVRDKSFTPRMQAKIPKCFAHEYIKDDIYFWLDSSLQLSDPDSVKYFLEQLADNEVLVLRHPDRPNIRQEVRYTRKGVNQKSIYMYSRYVSEGYEELYSLIQKDNYIDDLLVIGGVFLYRPTEKVKQMLKEWFYYITRYCIQDQISFAYVLKKSGVKFKVIDDNFMKTKYLKVQRHAKRNQ